MQILLFFIVPLALPLVMSWFLDRSIHSETWRSCFIGMVLAIPAVIIWFLLGFIYRPVWGSALLLPIFFLRFWFLPFLFLILAWIPLRGLEGLLRGQDFHKLMGFSFGFMTIFNFAHTASLWLESYLAWTLILPILLLATLLVFPWFFEEFVKSSMPESLLWIGALILALFMPAAALATMFLRLEWLGISLAAVYTALSAFMGIGRLKQEAMVRR